MYLVTGRCLFDELRSTIFVFVFSDRSCAAFQPINCISDKVGFNFSGRPFYQAEMASF